MIHGVGSLAYLLSATVLDNNDTIVESFTHKWKPFSQDGNIGIYLPGSDLGYGVT